MIYVVMWSYKPEKRDEIQARFKKTGGMPPAGVTMVGRWHQIGGPRGLAVAESDDPVAIAKWAQDWSDLLTFDIFPALNDEDLATTIG